MWFPLLVSSGELFWANFEPYLSLQFLSADGVLASCTKLKNIIKKGTEDFQTKTILYSF